MLVKINFSAITIIFAAIAAAGVYSSNFEQENMELAYILIHLGFLGVLSAYLHHHLSAEVYRNCLKLIYKQRCEEIKVQVGEAPLDFPNVVSTRCLDRRNTIFGFSMFENNVNIIVLCGYVLFVLTYSGVLGFLIFNSNFDRFDVGGDFRIVKSLLIFAIAFFTLIHHLPENDGNFVASTRLVITILILFLIVVINVNIANIHFIDGISLYWLFNAVFVMYLPYKLVIVYRRHLKMYTGKIGEYYLGYFDSSGLEKS